MTIKVAVIGRNGFLAGHLIRALSAQGCQVLPLSHQEPERAITADHVVNCAIDPAFRTQPYRTEMDFDLRAARLAAAGGIGFTMLSSRKVYANGWNAREADISEGDGSIYGRNKALSEAAVQASGAASTIFRLGNMFGMEIGRPSFFGRMLSTLSRSGRILFDMAARTRRDFLPVEDAAATIIRGIGLPGVYNLGAGFATPCGDIAAWVMEGFGGGTLVVQNDAVRDEFLLNMDKTRAALGGGISQEALRARCIAIGRACRKS